ncbi:protein of unknown function [Taphrina deformans PYCC 5710]|uniref:SDE2-like domain-containing protein n=1 Tax=Taphrina deformans (strain PYCC 5710 / ATCC 11124 / CBS 356.35 / IMI 108563 / JCM 9778 / NBRC 8474) TaxID=1097556 RepID=R4XH07_TAPDE|nr:protein of unknown function [Taphrina deformans PYCC 5710]|eukprot:CCG84973.1 protein of unknown function [Taphrina deformans PYCC 5710]
MVVMRNIIVYAPAPYNTLCIPCAGVEDEAEDGLDATIHVALSRRLPPTLLRDCTTHYAIPYTDTTSHALFVRVTGRLGGGKGGFGSQLRASRGARGRTRQDDSAMADVSGRKRRTVKQAERAVAQVMKERQTGGSDEGRRKRQLLMAVLDPDHPSPQTPKFDDEAYFGTSERLLADLKHALAQAHDGESDSGAGEFEDEGDDEGEASGESAGRRERGSASVKVGPRKLQGWDDDDDDDDDYAQSSEEEAPDAKLGMGKQKVPIKATEMHLRKRVKAN